MQNLLSPTTITSTFRLKVRVDGLDDEGAGDDDDNDDVSHHVNIDIHDP